MTNDITLAIKAQQQGDGTYIPVIVVKDGNAKWDVLNIDELRENG